MIFPQATTPPVYFSWAIFHLLGLEHWLILPLFLKHLKKYHPPDYSRVLNNFVHTTIYFNKKYTQHALIRHHSFIYFWRKVQVRMVKVKNFIHLSVDITLCVSGNKSSFLRNFIHISALLCYFLFRQNEWINEPTLQDNTKHFKKKKWGRRWSWRDGEKHTSYKQK